MRVTSFLEEQANPHELHKKFILLRLKRVILPAGLYLVFKYSLIKKILKIKYKNKTEKKPINPTRGWTKILGRLGLSTTNWQNNEKKHVILRAYVLGLKAANIKQ